MLVTLLSTEHLYPITRRFRKRFREHCLGYKLGLSPRRGSRKPELHPCLLLEAPVAVSTQLWSDKFPKCSNLGYHARIPWSKGVLARPCCTPISTAPLWCFGGYFSLLAATFMAGEKAKARYNKTLRQETSFNFRTKPLTTDKENHKLA